MYTCLLPIKLFIIFVNAVWNYIFSFILISILGRSDWPFFCRHVTGSHEDVMWSLWHQFNDVPDFFTVLFHGFPGIFDQHRQRGVSGCYGFYIHGDLHLGKRTSRQPPSLCCWLHTQERGDTICLQKRRMMRKLSERHEPTEFGKSWMQRHSGCHYIVFKAWSATGLLL